MLTILLALTTAVFWGAPDVLMAQAARRVGPLAVLVGAITVGTCAVAPAALFVDPPRFSAGAVALAALTGVLTVIAFATAFQAFATGAVSVVAPIVACEGGVAAVLAVAGGERLGGVTLAALPVAVAGVVLAAMGEGGGRGGALLASASAVVWGVVLVLSAPVADDLGVFWGFFLIRLSALATLLVVVLPLGHGRGWTGQWWRVAAFGLGDAAAYLAFVGAVAGSRSVAVAGVIAAQWATVAVVLGMVFLGERLRRRQLAGVVLVLASVSVMAAASG